MDQDLQITQRQGEGIQILELRGRLVIGQTEAKLREYLMVLAKTGLVNVILDFANARGIDDDGLGALILSNAQLRASGGCLKLLNLSRLHIDLSILMRLDAEFEVFNQEQDAIDSFFPDRVNRRYDILEFVEEQENILPPRLAIDSVI